jgi:uncharacterized protein involved in exopolysaccharide biosynthesis
MKENSCSKKDGIEMQSETCNDGINLLDFVRVILKNKWLICWVVGVCVAATIIISLAMTPVFEAKAVIMPVETSGAKSGIGSAMSAQLGFGGQEGNQKTEIIGLLKSNMLREKIIKKYDLLPVLFGNGVLKDKYEDKRIWMALELLNTAISVTGKLKENTVEVSVRFKDKKVAADIVKYLLAELTVFMSTEEKRVAEDNKKHLESTVDKTTTDPIVKTSLYNLIAKQVEKAAMAEATENFAFKVIDPPRVPDSRIKPRRTQMVMISFAVSLFLGIFLAFGKEYVVNHKGELNELKELSGLSGVKWLRWGHRPNRIGEQGE